MNAIQSLCIHLSEIIIDYPFKAAKVTSKQCSGDISKSILSDKAFQSY